ASVIAPLASKNTRVIAGFSDDRKSGSLSTETVIKLTPSPRCGGLTVCTDVVTSTKRTLQASSQCRKARRTVAITSVSCLMFGGGSASELENEIRIGLISHLRARIPELSRYCRV